MIALSRISALSACVLLSAGAASHFSPGAFAQERSGLREAAEVTVRGGIPNILAKLRAGGGGEIRVAYLGGSITAAPGWRVKSLEWLKRRHPMAQPVEINAAIGGTGSDLGVFRLEQDVLRHRPDFLFVEFAVNDGGADPARIHQAMEGIVRQTWKANPATDICFVYTVSEPFLADLQAGKCSRSATAMEEVADRYGIPSIHLGLEAARMVSAGGLVFKAEKPKDEDLLKEPWVFSSDGVHPLVETGHELYLRTIARSWEALEAAAGEPKPHALAAPLREDNWEAAKLIPLGEVPREGTWQKLDPEKDDLAKRFGRLMPEMWRASEPGAGLRFRFRGTVAGVYDLVGPDGGQLSVALDGEAAKIVPRFDAYCTYHRLSKLQVGGNLDGAAVHEARLTLDAASPDKRKILFEKNRPDFDGNPAKYEGRNWYAGAVMLIGDLVE
ncbi:MAG: SGNH/GDSL hydrolase family protein [Verrucomicrobiae bacterium]|nr:SGNH/GDSL hydrolase family protein [Verrucomicrobiae bacterium]